MDWNRQKGDHSHMTVVLFWIALFLIAIVAFLITARVQAVKWLNGVSLLIPSFIIFFSSGVLLHYPYMLRQFREGEF